MKALPLDKAQFDAKARELDALVRDWADRECTPFDEAVRKAAGVPEPGGSIWTMPAIDSKRVVSLLAELEPVLGCKLPSLLVKRGGYANPDELRRHLIPKIRELCPDGPATDVGRGTSPAVATTTIRSL